MSAYDRIKTQRIRRRLGFNASVPVPIHENVARAFELAGLAPADADRTALAMAARQALQQWAAGTLMPTATPRLLLANATTETQQ